MNPQAAKRLMTGALTAPFIGALTLGTQADRVAVLLAGIKARIFRPCKGYMALWLSPTEAIMVLQSDVDYLVQTGQLERIET
jgi:hypothetical protein